MAAGVLVVQKVIPGSCAEGHIEPGDVLTRVHSGRKGAADFASFVSFEELLDDSVRIYCRKPWLQCQDMVQRGLPLLSGDRTHSQWR